MFPIRDSIPQVRTPTVVYSLIIVNALIFFYQLNLSAMAGSTLSIHLVSFPTAIFSRTAICAMASRFTTCCRF
jgi:hypothetical protein